MSFLRYPHLEKYGTDETDGINIGTTFVFPKIDGANASIWLNNDGHLCCGSRNREVSLDNDLQGFMSHVLKHASPYLEYFKKHPDHRLYGEWLVPHTIKHYRESAWNKFYVFDVMAGDGTFLPYEVYKPWLDEAGVLYVPCFRQFASARLDDYVREAQACKFLIDDPNLFGEGIVIKNYGWTNKYQRVTWAKIVNGEFKEHNYKEFNHPVSGGRLVEEMIVDEFVSEALIDKEIAKITNQHEGWSSKNIPQLLGTVFHCLCTEELWAALKKHRNPTIDFRALQNLTIQRIKKVRADLF
jgi:hypothetical protein